MKGAIVGAGFFAQFQIESWKRIKDLEIVAVADPDDTRREKFARQWGIPRGYSSAAAMLEKEQLSFVDIVTRPESHLELTELAANAGVHVICQKPMAPAPSDCVRMIHACQRNGVRLIVHENWRWQPWYREIRRIIDSGCLGQVFQISFRMRTGDGLGPEPYKVQPYFREMPRLLIYETLVHFLDTSLYLGGPVGRVYCRTARLNPVIAGEDSAIIQLGFASGAGGLIDANRISGEMPPKVAFGECRIEGTEAALRMSPEGDLFLTVYGSPEQPHPYSRPEIGYKGDSVHALQTHIAERLRNGEEAECEAPVYMKTVSLVEACYQSAGNGQEVALA